MKNNTNIKKIKTKSQFLSGLNVILYASDPLYIFTEATKEKANIGEIIIDVLRMNNKEMTVNDLQISSEKLSEFSNQKISAILFTMVKNGLVNKTIKDNKSYFSVDLNNSDNDDNNGDDFFNYFGSLYVEDSEKIVENATYKYEKEDYLDTIEKSIDKEKLIKYLNTLIDLNSDIYSLQQRYDFLRDEMLNKILKNVPNFRKINSELIKEKENIINEIEKINNISKPAYIKEITLEIPEKKKKPILKIVKPEEPKYLVPNFFNKKKIQIENERLKNNYEKELETYNIEYEKYVNELKEYDNYLVDYEKELEEIKNKEQVLNDENYNKKLQEYEKVKKESELILNDKKLKLKNFENNYFSKIDEKLLENEDYKDIKKARYELEYIESLIQKDIELEKDLYSYGIIYGKYRNFVAITSFYDYLMSSRCSTLEGADGAYNLFEQETRSNLIVERLDKIITSLDEIKSMQYCIYNQMTNINKSLDLINDQLLVNNLLETVQISQLNDIINNTESIAYNTSVTAYYSKKIANYTKALTILTFLK